MSLSPINSLSASTAAGSQNNPNSFRKNFQQLEQSLSQGDLSGAQAAYAALTQSNSPLTNSNNPLSQDLAAVGKALSSGDLSGAQSSFQKLQQDFKSQFASQTQGVPQGHHHHGHRAEEATQTAQPDTTIDVTA